MKLINIGFGSLIAAERVLSVLEPESAPIIAHICPLCKGDALVHLSDFSPGCSKI